MPSETAFSHPSMTELRYKTLRFLITDSPDNDNLQAFIEVSQARLFVRIDDVLVV
jgi:hypothetical protein